MLPKVATHIFHHTTRAAAAVQNQTTQAIRNAWQYQQVTPTGSGSVNGGITSWGGVSSSSGWSGGSNAGPGGAKFNTGSRFYTGYTGPGRTVSQANSSLQNDDEERSATLHAVRIAHVSEPVRPRRRSNSLSLSSQARIDRGMGLGVLQVVQARARHAFAENFASLPINDLPAPSDDTTRPLLIRRNSTTAQSDSSSDINSDLARPASSGSDYDGLDITDPARPQTVEEPIIANDIQAYERIRDASHRRDVPKLMAEIENYRAQSRASVPCYNMAMQALLDNRAVGQPVSPILELYNEMLHRNLVPNLRTYKIMIYALCTRDADIQRVIATTEERLDRRLFAGSDLGVTSLDEQRLNQLRSENNFASAVTLFQAATVVRDQALGLPEYNALLRSCAFHRNVDVALRVFAHLERFPRERPSPVTYIALLSVYHSVGDLKGAQSVFDDFKVACRQGRIAWVWSLPHRSNTSIPTDPTSPSPTTSGPSLPHSRPELCKVTHVQLWNKMIDIYFKCGEPALAIDLFDTMLATPRGQDFTETDSPLPNALTYTAIIAGFCQSGDVDSALKWFNRLLKEATVVRNPYLPLSETPRPTSQAWYSMIDHLARAGRVDELNHLFKNLLATSVQDDINVRMIDRYVTYRANANAMDASDVTPARVDGLLDFVLEHVMNLETGGNNFPSISSYARHMLDELVVKLMVRGQVERAIELSTRYVERERRVLDEKESDGSLNGQQVLFFQKGLRGLVQSLSGTILSHSPAGSPLSFPHVIRLATLAETTGMEPQASVAPIYIQSYLNDTSSGQPLSLTLHEYELLIKAYLAVEMPPLDSPAEGSEHNCAQTSAPPGFKFPGIVSLLGDMAQANVEIRKLDRTTMRKVVKALAFTHGPETAVQIIQNLGPKFAHLLDYRGVPGTSQGSGAQAGTSIPSIDKTSGGIHIDLYHTRFVEEWWPFNPSVTPQMAYTRFESGLERGIYPSPECIGRLIGGLGRIGELEKVRTLYDAGQRVLAALEDQKRWQSAGWFVIEDQMIIALAHLGDLDAANVHRQRVIENGGTPSADAYGALISGLKDTTDDAMHAMQYWDDAMSRQVRPNIFMYNVMISKLSKARKAEQALHLYGRMKDQGIKPSPVTYGVLIAACCRVGDASAAEGYFHEMTTAANYKPRPPPYNTMIQFYTYTKPNRDRALYYYNALLEARVKPTSYTYKLLLDAYGTIEPVDTVSMEDIFQRVLATEVNGAHWASMIHAYGCACKDLNRAIGIFESIVKHPSTARAKTSLPDALAYEALLDVFATHRRPDLIQVYFKRLQESRIHATAYVVNAAIKGYAASGDIESARTMFETMEDPPMGIAAPHNHSPPASQLAQAQVPPEIPAYREPSTWEVMVRTELGAGEYERAKDLISRMESRGYPEPVVQRVRDIMYTDTPSGTPSADSSLSPISSD